MEFKEIKELIKLVNESNLTNFTLKNGEFSLRIAKQKEFVTSTVVTTTPQVVSTPVQQTVQTPQNNAVNTEKKVETQAENINQSSNTVPFKSPMIGTFYRSAKADAEPFVKVGDVISKGQVIGIIEAMKIFNEIEADFNGKIVKVLIDNSSPVEYDQPLFLIEPTS